MTNPYGLVLDDASLQWAVAESVSEAVIAAICLLETRSVDEIVAKITPAELEQVIKIIGRCPRCYPAGAYDALKARRTLSPTRHRGERVNPAPERSHRGVEQTKPTHPWTPPREFGFGAKPLKSTPKRATANPYGITLNREWTQWAANHGVSETTAAALYLISMNRKPDDVAAKLRPIEMDRVITFVQRWPEHFPPTALAALKHSGPKPPAGPTRPSSEPARSLNRATERVTAPTAAVSTDLAQLDRAGWAHSGDRRVHDRRGDARRGGAPR
jgi:hypothetical protein